MKDNKNKKFYKKKRFIIPVVVIIIILLIGGSTTSETQQKNDTRVEQTYSIDNTSTDLETITNPSTVTVVCDEIGSGKWMYNYDATKYPNPTVIFTEIKSDGSSSKMTGMLMADSGTEFSCNEGSSINVSNTIEFNWQFTPVK